MMRSTEHIRFWLLLLLQAVGSQMILWGGLPVYRRLHAPVPEGAHTSEFAFALVAVALMQLAHWLAVPLLPKLRLRRNLVLGYALVTFGEVSLFFATALSAFIVFDLSGVVKITLSKAAIMAAILYATSCYKHLLGEVGNGMICTERRGNPSLISHMENADAPQ